MPQTSRSSGAPSLSIAIVGFVAFGALLAIVLGWYLVSARGNAFREDALSEAVTVRAQAVELDFARTLHQEWLNARTIASEIARRDSSAIQSSLDLVVGDGSRVSWAGIASLEGKVVVASGGMLQGRDVSERPWFQRGLEGNFAGDVHEAKLLAQLLPSQGGEPFRFLDLATPVRNERGEVTGVLGLHLNYAWALSHLRDSASALKIDVFLIDRQGKIVMGTDESVDRLELSSARAAMTGAAFTGIETWSDGKPYFTTVLPQFGYEDLPSFGWSLIARIDDGAIYSPPRLSAMLAGPAAFGLFLVLATALFIQVFARPFSKLAASASAILEGEDVYPYESNSTSEAATLSMAIARIERPPHP